MDNDEMFKRFVDERFLGDGTMTSYKHAIKPYCSFNNMTLTELINEAEEEEMKGVRWKYSSLKKRLESYRLSMYKSGKLNESTIQLRIRVIKIIYAHFEIELGKLHQFKPKSVKQSMPLTTKDIPTVDELRKIINMAKPLVHQSLLHFMSSTGLARVDAMNIDVETFINSCSGYYDDSDNLQTILESLSVSEDVVPTLHLKRQKTNKWFYTFATPESVRAVSNYLITRDNLALTDRVFKLNSNYYYTLTRKLNKQIGFNKNRDGKWKFRGHLLRKFHAKQLRSGVDGMSIDDVDALQGRSKDRTHEAYFVDDPIMLKKKYMQHMHKLVLFDEIKVHTIESDEYKELREKNELYRDKLMEQEKMIDEINKNQERMRDLLGL